MYRLLRGWGDDQRPPAEYWSYPQRSGKEIVGAVVAFIDVTERRRTEQALSGLSRKLIQAQEQERTRIARELHDDIAQRLALLAIELEQIEQNPPESVSEGRTRMRTLRKQAADISTDVQSLSHELHSSKLEYLGIVVAMRSFCKEFGGQQKMEIDFRGQTLRDPLSKEISISLFRVLQEALHNAAKHSGVRHFEVELLERSGEIHLTVHDSGAGFDRRATKEGGGLGLTSMRERLKLVDGELSIESQPGQGTTVHASVPISSEGATERAAG
jgi:signal transduction histidine kinase